MCISLWSSLVQLQVGTFALLAERWDGAPGHFPTLCTALFVFSAVLARVHADLHIRSSVLTFNIFRCGRPGFIR